MEDDLLLRYLYKKVNADERLAVEAWLSQDKENYQTMETVALIDGVRMRRQIMDTVDTQAALKRVSAKIRRQTLVRNVFIYTQRIAAILLLPLVGWLGYYMFEASTLRHSMIEVASQPGMTTVVNLPDGSLVTLNARSKLFYPAKFSNSARTVRLEGEGYFNIAKNKRVPFCVQVGRNYQLKVLGTIFNIEAYPNDSLIKTTLVEGSVSLAVKGEKETFAQILQPNQSAVYNIRRSTLSTKYLATDEITAWKDNKIIFRDTPLNEIMNRLAKQYNVSFTVSENIDDSQYRFTGEFSHEQLERILKFMSLTSNLTYRIENKVENNKVEQTVCLRVRH